MKINLRKETYKTNGLKIQTLWWNHDIKKQSKKKKDTEDNHIKHKRKQQ